MGQLQITTEDRRRTRKAEPKPATEALLPEDEAAELLGVSRRTIQNYVYSGRITPDMYSTGPTGKRFYHREKLMGI